MPDKLKTISILLVLVFALSGCAGRFWEDAGEVTGVIVGSVIDGALEGECNARRQRTAVRRYGHARNVPQRCPSCAMPPRENSNRADSNRRAIWEYPAPWRRGYVQRMIDQRDGAGDE